MTDEELERRLRQWRVGGPSADVRRRVLAAPPPNSHRSDFVVGWVIAMTAAGCVCVSAWMTQRTMRDRLEVILLESDVAAQIQNVEAFLGPQARERILLSLLAAEPPEGRLAIPPSVSFQGAPPW
jgi:hypothetical protein